MAPPGDRRHLQGVPDRHQGPAHDARRRRLPLPERGPAPDPRPLRLPPAGALVPGRAEPGQDPRAGRHGDLPGEHRGHLRRPRGRGGHRGGHPADRPAEEGVRLGHPPGLGRGHQAGVRDRLEAPHPGRHQLRRQAQPQERDPGAQGQHHEVHRGRLPQLGLRARARGVLRRGRRLGRLRRRTRGQDPRQGRHRRHHHAAGDHPARRVRRHRHHEPQRRLPLRPRGRPGRRASASPPAATSTTSPATASSRPPTARPRSTPARTR